MFWPPFSISPDRKGETSKRQGRKAQTSHPLLSGCLLPTSGPVSTWAAVTSETSATSRDMRGINFCGRGKQVCPSPVAAELSKFFVRRGLQSIIRWRWDSQGLQAILHSLNSTTTPPPPSTPAPAGLSCRCSLGMRGCVCSPETMNTVPPLQATLKASGRQMV